MGLMLELPGGRSLSLQLCQCPSCSHHIRLRWCVLPRRGAECDDDYQIKRKNHCLQTDLRPVCRECAGISSWEVKSPGSRLFITVCMVFICRIAITRCHGKIQKLKNRFDLNPENPVFGTLYEKSSI